MAESRNREALLDEIEAIIRREGFADLRVGELSARVHCSRSTLYKLAPSKDELVVLVLDRLADKAQAEARQAASAPGLSAAERIIAFTHVINEWQGRCALVLWRDWRAMPAAAAMLAERNSIGVGVVAGFIEEGMRTGEFRQVNARYTTRVISEAANLTRDARLLEDAGLSAGDAMEELGLWIARGLSRD